MAQAYDHTCEIINGGSVGSLVKYRPLAATDIANNRAYAGRVVYIDSNGYFKVGVPTGKKAMPLFLIRGMESPSVFTDGGTDWQPVRSGNVAVAAVATGGFELQSTEFDTAQTYAPNTALTCDANGVLRPGTFGTDWIVGIASVYENQENYRPVPSQLPAGYNANGKRVLTFWSYFYPGT